MPQVSVKGAMIHYECSERNSLPVILIHGAGGSGQRWAAQLTGLRGQANVIAPDLPGHGESGGDLLTDIQGMADFVKDFTEALGADKFILAGHSMGGAIVQEFALRYPGKAAGLILIGTGARLKVGQTVLEGFAAGKLPFKDVNHLYGSCFPEAGKAEEMQELLKVPLQTLAADFQACNTFNHLEDVEKIQIPCLILVGDEDVMTPAKYSEYLASKLADARMHVVRTAGHTCMQEKPEEVNAEILGFLAGFQEC